MDEHENPQAVWYYSFDGRNIGPLSTDQLRSLLQNGEIAAETSVWKDGMADWTGADKVPELCGDPPHGPPPTLAGATNAPRALGADTAIASEVPASAPSRFGGGAGVKRSNGFFGPPASYFVYGGLCGLVIICAVLTIIFGLQYAKIKAAKVRDLAQQVLGEAGLKRQLTQEIDQLRRQDGRLRNAYSIRSAQWQTRLAALDGKISSAQDHFRHQQALLRDKLNELASEQRQLVASGSRQLAASRAVLAKLRKYGPAVLAKQVLQSIDAEHVAAGTLAKILNEDAQIQTADAPAIRNILVNNFSLKHTGASALATALERDTISLAQEADKASAMNASRPDTEALIESHRVIFAADAALRAAISQSTEIVANVGGSVVMTGGDGVPTPLAGVRVILIPKRINKARMLRILNAQKQYLNHWLAQARSAINTLNGNLNNTLPVTAGRTGTVLGYVNGYVGNTLCTKVDSRLQRLKKILAGPPDGSDARRMFLSLWDYGDPIFYKSGNSFPLVFRYSQPNASLFLPWGVPAWIQHYATNPSGLTHSDGSFRIRSVPAGAYYAFAYHSAQPFAAWMVPVTVSSRQTVHIHLDSGNPIEVSK